MTLWTKLVSKNSFLIIILLLFVGDCFYSFYQFTYDQIQGDLAYIILPSEHYSQVLKDPLGFKAAFQGEHYPATNRYTNHIFMYVYFRVVPWTLQMFTNPINSVYLAMHILKFISYLSLVFSLSLFVKILLKHKVRLGYILLTVFPFIFVIHYSQYGISLHTSIAYTAAYAFFTSLMIFFLLPVLDFYINGYDFFKSKIKYCVWLLLAILLSLSGPLVAPCLMIFALLTLLFDFLKYFQISTQMNFILQSQHWIKQINKYNYLVFTIFLSALYSFYVGKFNSENSKNTLSLYDRYYKAIEGYKMYFFDRHEGMMLLVGLVFVVFVIYYFSSAKISNEFKTIVLLTFSSLCIYLLLLPLGGYREYRPLIIRSDTALPITCLLIIMFSYISQTLMLNLNIEFQKYLKVALMLIAFYFVQLDELPHHHNFCQKEEIKKISESKADCIQLRKDCTIMSWYIFGDCEDTKVQSDVLYLWNITDRPVAFYQE